jgi:copper homeostasis protein (lipoprotein)
MSPSIRILLLSCPLSLAVAGCQPAAEADRQATETAAVAPSEAVSAQDTERVWSGLLPCRDCQGIDTRLVLRTQAGRRAYLLTETYLGGRGPNSFNRAGSWTEMHRTVGGEPQVLYVLDPDRAAQRFQLQPDGALEMLDANGKPSGQPVAYRLQRL